MTFERRTFRAGFLDNCVYLQQTGVVFNDADVALVLEYVHPRSRTVEAVCAEQKTHEACRVLRQNPSTLVQLYANVHTSSSHSPRKVVRLPGGELMIIQQRLLPLETRIGRGHPHPVVQTAVRIVGQHEAVAGR